MNTDLAFDSLLTAAADIPHTLLGRGDTARSGAPTARDELPLELPADPFAAGFTDGVFGVIDVSEALIPAQWSRHAEL